MKAEANVLFNDALAKLQQAKEEFFRPEEDLMTYLICRNAQYSIENFLKGYLVQQEVDPEMYQSMDKLYEKCISLNRDFARVDLAAFDCKYHSLNSSECNDLPRISNCLKIATSLESFLRQEKVL